LSCSVQTEGFLYALVPGVSVTSRGRRLRWPWPDPRQFAGTVRQIQSGCPGIRATAEQPQDPVGPALGAGCVARAAASSTYSSEWSARACGDAGLETSTGETVLSPAGLCQPPDGGPDPRPGRGRARWLAPRPWPARIRVQT